MTMLTEDEAWAKYDDLVKYGATGSYLEEARQAIFAATPVADTAGIDAAWLMEAMNEAFTYEDCDNAQPTLPFFDDVEAFWTPFAAKVAAEYAALRTPKPEGDTKPKRIDWSNVVVDEGDEAP